MSLDKKALEKALRKKGFKSSNSHHRFFVYHTEDGEVTPVRTKVSHTPKMKQISVGLVIQIAKQLRLSKAQLRDLVNCPLSREDYEAILRAGGHI